MYHSQYHPLESLLQSHSQIDVEVTPHIPSVQLGKRMLSTALNKGVPTILGRERREAKWLHNVRAGGAGRACRQGVGASGWCRQGGCRRWGARGGVQAGGGCKTGGCRLGGEGACRGGACGGGAGGGGWQAGGGGAWQVGGKGGGGGCTRGVLAGGCWHGGAGGGMQV